MNFVEPWKWLVFDYIWPWLLTLKAKNDSSAQRPLGQILIIIVTDNIFWLLQPDVIDRMIRRVVRCGTPYVYNPPYYDDGIVLL